MQKQQNINDTIRFDVSSKTLLSEIRSRIVTDILWQRLHGTRALSKSDEI
jgi:hypothetical protein